MLVNVSGDFNVTGTTTNFQLEHLAKGIKNFRGVYSIDKLPNQPWHTEKMIVNLQSTKDGQGTHWVSFSKKGNNIWYYDSFGDLRPPLLLLKYWGEGCSIYYNFESDQKITQSNCGQNSIKFLRKS